MKLIEAPDPSFGALGEPDLFLAGGITGCPDWQAEMAGLLAGTCLTVYNPRRKNFPIHDPNAAKAQIEWEYLRLDCASMVLFWFARGSLNPIVLYELGMWGNSRVRPIFVGCDPHYERTQDVLIQTGLARPEVRVAPSLLDLAEQVRQAALRS
jgi:hypothetical protein